MHLPIWIVNDISTSRALIHEATVKGTLDVLITKFSSTEIPTVFGSQIGINLPALLVCLVITYILIRGIRTAVNTNMTLVILKVSVILFVIIVEHFSLIQPTGPHYIPTPTLNSQGNMSFGVSGILAGAAYVCFAYLGFDAVATQAGEAKNPRKDIPFAILVSLSICTILYVLVTLVVTGMVKYTDIDITAPIADAFGKFGLSFSVWIISIAAVAGLTSVLLVNILAQSRLFLAMSNDGLLPKKFFGRLHSKFSNTLSGNSDNRFSDCYYCWICSNGYNSKACKYRNIACFHHGVCCRNGDALQRSWSKSPVSCTISIHNCTAWNGV